MPCVGNGCPIKPEKASASALLDAKTHGGKSIPTKMRMTSGLFAPAHPVGNSSFPTTRIQNTVPEIAIMPQSEKREQQHPGGVMPLFSLPEFPHRGGRESDKETQKLMLRDFRSAKHEFCISVDWTFILRADEKQTRLLK